MGRVADALPGAERLHRGDLPHLLLQPDLRRPRRDRRHALRGQGGHGGGRRPPPDAGAARPGSGARRQPHGGRDDRQRLPRAGAAPVGPAVHAGLPVRRRRADRPAGGQQRVHRPAPGRSAEHRRGGGPRRAGLAGRRGPRRDHRGRRRPRGALRRPAHRVLAGQPAAGARGPAPGVGGRAALRVPGVRAQPVPPPGHRLPRLLRPGRGTAVGGHHRRPGLRVRAPPRRDPGRARPGQDRLLHQRQPRVPHPADPPARARRGRAHRRRSRSVAGSASGSR